MTSTARFAAQKRLISSSTSGYVTFRTYSGTWLLPKASDKPQQLQRAHGGVVHTALQHDAEILRSLSEKFIQRVFLNEPLRRGPSLLNLLLLVHEAGRRQNDAAGVADRVFHRVLQRELRGEHCPWQ